MMKKLLLFISLLPALIGCASHQPIPDGYSGDLTTIKDSYEYVTSTKIYIFQLAKVDDRDVHTSSAATYERSYGQGFNLYLALEERQVPATNSVLHIEGLTYVAAPVLAFLGGMYSVSGDVTVNLDAGKLYYVKGKLSEDYSAVWLEDQDGNIVSEKIEIGSK